mmetsp:Transcript_104460/g.185807  ORF Transcript_104460/g.185807 Transcript_104460/m.185807 type:complete len:481 (+) Transcript_104460:60-1502(+)
MAPSFCPGTKPGGTSYYPPPQRCRPRRNPGRAAYKSDAANTHELQCKLDAEPGITCLEEIPSPTRSRARLAEHNLDLEVSAQKDQSQASKERHQTSSPQQGVHRQHSQKQCQKGHKLQLPPHLHECTPRTADATSPSRRAVDDLQGGETSPPGCVEVNPSELQILERVGVGATAEVHRAEWHGTDVAVKKMLAPLSFAMHAVAKDFDSKRPGRLTPSEIELGRRLADVGQFRRELALLQELRHPNLVLFMGAATVGEAPPLIVSEFCEGGTLFMLLHERKEVRLTWPQKLKSAMDTAKGMNFLHRRRVIHRDLKSLNLLLAGEVSGSDDMPWVKISDFGLSRRLPSEAIAPGLYRLPGSSCLGAACSSPVMTGGLGTCLWMAPELLSGRDYDERADVYSYGIVLFELICRRLPFDGPESKRAVSEAAWAVCNGRRPDLRHVPSCCPSLLQQVMEHSWAQRSETRPAFSRILEDLAAIAKL